MICELQLTEVPGVLWCPVCQQNTTSSETEPRRHRRTCRPKSPQEPGKLPVKPCGPGCQLRKLLKEMGFTEGGCNCAEMAAKMDRWGVDGCQEPEHFAEIVNHLEKEAAKAKQSVTRQEIEILVLTAIGSAAETG